MSQEKKRMKMNLADDVGEYEALSDERKAILNVWITCNFTSSPRALRNVTSYGLKHEFERSDEGFYVTNGQFKAAMRKAGHKPVRYGQNWRFRIARRLQ